MDKVLEGRGQFRQGQACSSVVELVCEASCSLRLCHQGGDWAEGLGGRCEGAVGCLSGRLCGCSWGCPDGCCQDLSSGASSQLQLLLGALLGGRQQEVALAFITWHRWANGHPRHHPCHPHQEAGTETRGCTLRLGWPGCLASYARARELWGPQEGVECGDRARQRQLGWGPSWAGLAPAGMRLLLGR